MGRSFPIAHAHANHPIILWSIFLSCIAATIALFLPLCGIFSSKKTSSPKVADAEVKENPEDVAQPVDDSKPKADASTEPSPVVLADDQNDLEQPDEEDYSIRPLPPPLPSMHEPSSPRDRSKSISAKGRLTSSMSKLKIVSALSSVSKGSKGKGLSSSMSMGMVDNRTMASRQASKREDKKLKHEDSIWKKTIILGEKCKVPEDDEDTVVYDEKGNRISTYHPRTNSTPGTSRCNSERKN